MPSRDRLATLGKNLRALRKKRGLSGVELAVEAGVDRSYLSSLENGTARSYPKPDTLEKLARPLRATVGQLTGEDASPVAETPYDRNPSYRKLIDSIENSPASERDDLTDRFRWFAERLSRKHGERSFAFSGPRDTKVRITLDEEKKTEDLRAAIKRSMDLEWRDGFRGEGRHVVRRGSAIPSAGPGSEVDSTDDEEPKYREIPQHYWDDRGARQTLRIRGNSMILRGFVDRDLIFVKPITQRPPSNTIVVCEVDDKVFLKIFEVKGDRVRLLSANPDAKAYPPIAVEPSSHFKIHGIVVGRSGYGLEADGT